MSVAHEQRPANVAMSAEVGRNRKLSGSAVIGPRGWGGNEQWGKERIVVAPGSLFY